MSTGAVLLSAVDVTR